MKKHLQAITFVILLIALGAAGLPALAGDFPVAVINTSDSTQSIHLRSEPNSNAKSLGEYYNGVIVVVKSASGTLWYQVDIHGRTGYVEQKQLTSCGMHSGYDKAVIDSVKSAKITAVVSGQKAVDGLHLRDRPSTTANSRGKFYNGTSVEIVGTVENGSWYHVYLPETGLYGFMLAKFVQPTEYPESPDSSQVPTGIYAVVNNPSASDRLNFRASASQTAKSLGKYYNGTTVELLDSGATWSKVCIDGKTGYMQSKYLLLDSSLKPLVKLDVGRNDISGPPYPTLRSAPSDHASAASLPDPKLGGSLTILAKAGTWYYVEVQGVKGYYPANKVLPGAKNPTKENIAIVTGPNWSDRLNLRSSTSKTASILGKYFVGTQVEVLDYNVTGVNERENMWYQVKVNGKKGYMQAKYLQDLQTGDPSTW